MKKYNIYIVEDMAVTRAAIASVLKQKEYTICGSAVTAEKAWVEIRELPVDLVLLDLNLKGNKNGLWLARRIRESANCAIVYLTAYGSDGILSQIHETEPDGYIMKPFNNPTLISTVKVALRNFNRQHALLKKSDSEVQYAFVRCKKGLVQINSNDVLYLKSEGNYVSIFNENNTCHTTRDKLISVLEHLSFDNLFRVHRRYAVNAKKVAAIRKEAIEMKGMEIPVSGSFEADLLREQFLK
ncbi:LytR/AlgR family response regulator transcription factor [Sinomicrobium weinanense]|uniref:Response regulator transcription factor n=1 Tax=Sinomicrobium weinanense TaxID=2842200 RepID=A0A926JV56_9FLAO|nr:response regulator transcription factor [Sinomicrobium weinanense]MBC9797944.1 response regulator transcription factor [Sinomicrobium weinanense]MBU3123264.1 response regulator transcription factor [Sinomicrobium weinanense]